jgi:ribonuclease T2
MSGARLPAVVLVLLLAGDACAQHRSHEADNTAGSFDYYLLTLSWAPQFCATKSAAASSSECDPARHYGYVVHGLWPQNDNGSYPQHCASARPVSSATARQMLGIMPSRGLIQHEWETHGTCSGLNPQDYFEAISKAFARLQIPDEYRAPNRPVRATTSEIEQKFAEANHAPPAAFRISCYESDFVGLEVCLTKDLQYRSCGSRLRECRAPQVVLRPIP